ncbi:MAG: DUF58 domain-containing protein [Anaerolineales bacterium]
MSNILFDPGTLRKLEQLTLIPRQVRAGAIKGERRSKKRGTSIEFADYRDYVKGDDLRRVDWNIYARLERPFIKLLEEEEDLATHFLIDASGSMDWTADGIFGHNKFVWSLRVLAGLAYLSLMSGDFVTVAQLGGRQWGPHRGRAYLLPLLKTLETFQAQGDLSFNDQLRQYALRARRPGLAFVLSDLMDEDGYEDGLRALQARGFEVALIHILAPDEVEPQLEGDLRLIDVETGRTAEVTVDEETAATYRQRLRAWREEIGAFCLRRGIHYVTLDTSTPWEELILYELRKLGVLR